MTLLPKQLFLEESREIIKITDNLNQVNVSSRNVRVPSDQYKEKKKFF